MRCDTSGSSGRCLAIFSGGTVPLDLYSAASNAAITMQGLTAISCVVLSGDHGGSLFLGHHEGDLQVSQGVLGESGGT